MTEMQTADVVRLYTNLPLELLYTILEECKRLWIEGRYLVIMPDLKEGKWSKKYIPDKENGKYSTFTYDLEGFLALLKYCLFNTHLTFGGEIFKQFQGIVMGANSSTFKVGACSLWLRIPAHPHLHEHGILLPCTIYVYVTHAA